MARFTRTKPRPSTMRRGAIKSSIEPAEALKKIREAVDGYWKMNLVREG